MTVRESIEKAREKGYERVWLTNNFNVLCAEYWLNGEDSWKNSGVGPYVIEEYAGAEVERELDHPYIKDALMLSVVHQPELTRAACEKCLAASKKPNGKEKADV